MQTERALNTREASTTPRKLGVIMDPIATINPQHDSTFAMILAAQARGWLIYYCEQRDLYVDAHVACAVMRALHVRDGAADFYSLGPAHAQPLTALDVILLRQDPPVDQTYIHTTQIVELAERAGVLVVNKPQSLRAFNEKLFIHLFPELCAPTLVTQRSAQVRAFLETHADIICKPLDGMGGQGIFRLRAHDPNIAVVLELLTQHDRAYIMAQQYLPAIVHGDKRILLINGEPLPYAYARYAAATETRANIAAGGTGKGMPLTAREHYICAQLGPTLRAHGILFAGIDVIGDYLTEINITSPTCMRELDQEFNLDCAGQLIDCIAQQLAQRPVTTELINPV